MVHSRDRIRGINGLSTHNGYPGRHRRGRGVPLWSRLLMIELLAVLAAHALVMPTIKLPSGDLMPQLGFGTWLAAPGEVYKSTKVAIDAGYRHVDCAWCYNNEEEVGKAIGEKIGDGTVARSDLFITSKLWNNFHRAELVREGCVDSMTKLGLDYLDNYLIHFPVSFVPGCAEATTAEQVEQVPLAETWAAVEALVQEGLVRNIGVSNFEIPQLDEVRAVATVPVANNQFETHPYYARNELLGYCKSHGIAVTAHSSMGGANNIMSKFAESPPLKDDEAVLRVAEKHGATPQAVLLAWGMQRPMLGTAVIPKSVTPARIRANLHDPFKVNLDLDDLQLMALLDKPGLEGCFCHPKTPWLGRSEFTGSTEHYYAL